MFNDYLKKNIITLEYTKKSSEPLHFKHETIQGINELWKRDELPTLEKKEKVFLLSKNLQFGNNKNYVF